MIPYDDLPPQIARPQRMGAPGYTLILIPASTAQPIHVSIDGKPTDVDPYVVFDLSLDSRK